MNINIGFDKSMLAEAVMTILVEEQIGSFGFIEKLKDYHEHGTMCSDVMWVLDIMEEAIVQGVECTVVNEI